MKHKKLDHKEKKAKEQRAIKLARIESKRNAMKEYEQSEREDIGELESFFRMEEGKEGLDCIP